MLTAEGCLFGEPSVLRGASPPMGRFKSRGVVDWGVRIDRDVVLDINLHKSEEQRQNLSRS
jgi:hypothetical protein